MLHRKEHNQRKSLAAFLDLVRILVCGGAVRFIRRPDPTTNWLDGRNRLKDISSTHPSSFLYADTNRWNKPNSLIRCCYCLQILRLWQCWEDLQRFQLRGHRTANPMRTRRSILSFRHPEYCYCQTSEEINEWIEGVLFVFYTCPRVCVKPLRELFNKETDVKRCIGGSGVVEQCDWKKQDITQKGNNKWLKDYSHRMSNKKKKKKKTTTVQCVAMHILQTSGFKRVQ